MRDWVVGGALILSGDGVLLVQNRRRNGSHDWTPPGGVIDDGESLIEGLTREVAEETGLRVTEWAGPVYEVRCHAPDLGWRLRVEAHLAVAYEGELHVDDPDGIVVAARFVDVDVCNGLVAGGHRWVREPLGDWLAERWEHQVRPYGFLVAGQDPATLVVTRAEP
ncbi:MAG: NUDIX hydrolase [Acidimicrobiales bacterium]